MSTIKLDYLNCKPNQLTNQEMVEILGGNGLQTLTGLVKMGLGVYKTLNPDPTPPTPAQIHMAMGQNAVASGYKLHNQTLSIASEAMKLYPLTQQM